MYRSPERKKIICDSQNPGSSGLQKIAMVSEEEDEQHDEDSNCCVCNRYEAEELKNYTNVVFVTWGECMFENCNHWVHIRFCCDVK